jgi:predicted PurR-regulated permease PerM
MTSQTAESSQIRSTPLGRFTARLLIILVFTLLAVTLWQLADVLVLLFGSVLLAIGLCAVARLISSSTGMRRGLALACVFVAVVAVFGGASWVFGATVAAQFDDVVRVIPAGFKLFTGWVSQYAYGRQLLDQIGGQNGGPGSGPFSGANVLGAAAWATSMATLAASAVTRTLGYAVIALFAAIYLAAQPNRYRRLCLRLVPPYYRLIAEHLFEISGDVLQRWLVGQLVVMLTIGVLTGLGLWAMGIEAAAALGLMGGLLCFIPFVGAVLAAIPATLVALTQGPIYAASVVLMYVCVHFVEGNFITPMVQAEATSFPPVLAIFSTVAFSLLLGPVGVLLAAPLTLFLMSVVEVLYVQQALGEAPIGEDPLCVAASAAPFDQSATGETP